MIDQQKKALEEARRSREDALKATKVSFDLDSTLGSIEDASVRFRFRSRRLPPSPPDQIELPSFDVT